MCWCVFSPDASGPSLSLSLSLRQRTRSARRRNTIVTRHRLPPLSPGFHVASVFVKHLKKQKDNSLSRGPCKYARYTFLPELCMNHSAASRSWSCRPLMEKWQPVWVNSMRRTWAETFSFQSRCKLSEFPPQRNSTEE